MTAIPPPEPPTVVKALACALTILASYALGFLVTALCWAPPGTFK